MNKKCCNIVNGIVHWIKGNVFDKRDTMTVKKSARTGGFAALVCRQKLHNTNQVLEPSTIKNTNSTYNIVVGFNEKDQLQLLTKDDADDDKKIKDYIELKTTKCENIPINDIDNCVNIENYPNCNNTLVFYVTKNTTREAVVLKFENEQDFKRIYFTYKYFKMRNRLAKNTSNYNTNDSLFAKKKVTDIVKNRKSFDDYSLIDKGCVDYGLVHTIDSDGLTHLSVQQKSLNLRFDQPMSLIGIRNDTHDVAEIDSVIYTDIDIPTKPDRKRLFQKKVKAPQPPPLKDNQKVLKGEFVRVNVERAPDIIPKDSKANKVPDLIMFRDVKPKRNSPPSNLWSASNKAAGYESDREEWKSSRSQFSTTAFDSLARPTKMAMALTLRKPPRIEPVPQYYRMQSETKKLTPLPFRPNNFIQRPRLPRPTTEVKRNLLSTDHRKFTSLQNLELPKKLSEPKKPVDNKKNNNYSNISHRITGLTNKLRDLGNPSNTLGRFKAQSHGDVANLKPVLKTNSQDGNKRSVIRTCSSEPPKKVTFSAFATVQVV